MIVNGLISPIFNLSSFSHPFSFTHTVIFFNLYPTKYFRSSLIR